MKLQALFSGKTKAFACAGALLWAGAVANPSLSAQDQRVSVGVLAGVSVSVQSDRAVDHPDYFPRPSSTTVLDYSYSWTRVGGTLFLDAIYGYLDLAFFGDVGPVHGNEKYIVGGESSYDKSPNDLGAQGFGVNLGLGIKAPIAFSNSVTAFPMVGLDLVSSSRYPSGITAILPLFRIGAGVDFALDKNWFLRVLIDYSWSVNFNFLDIKTGIGTKL